VSAEAGAPQRGPDPAAALPRSGAFTLAGPAGPLACLLDYPSHDRGTRAAIFLHPHPQYGGTMHSKVVYRAARAARDAGMPTLRCNFRGVGGSAGAFDGGRGEAEDAEGALRFLAQRFPGRRLVAGGFSFGAWVAVRVGNAMPAVDALVSIGTPTTVYGVDYLAAVAKPILFVQGTADPIGPIAVVEAAAQHLGGIARLVRIEGADHLFTGREPQVYAAVREFLRAADDGPGAKGGGVE
jgi:uncharacterized protein